MGAAGLVMTVASFIILAIAIGIGMAGALAYRHYRNANGGVDGVWSWKDGGPDDPGS